MHRPHTLRNTNLETVANLIWHAYIDEKNTEPCHFQYSASKRGMQWLRESSGGAFPHEGLKLKAGADRRILGWEAAPFPANLAQTFFLRHWQPALKQARSSLQVVTPGVHPQFSPTPTSSVSWRLGHFLCSDRALQS